MLPLDKLAYFTRLRALKRLLENSRASAKGIVTAALVLILKRNFPELSRPRAERFLLQHQSVIGFAEWLSSRPLFDLAFWLSSAYASLVGNDIRKQNAMFFTPPELAERLIDNCLVQGGKLLNGRIIDPACGGAAFLAPVADRIAKHLESEGKSSRQILKHIEAKLVGIEVEPFLSRLSKFFIHMVLYEYLRKSNYQPNFKIHAADALTKCQKLHQAFDVVICNPPYRKMKALEVNGYAKAFGDIMEGQPNLYGLFFKLSLQLCKEGGLSGLVTPPSFLSGRDFSKLRTHLLVHAETRQIDLVSNRLGVFLGVEQETAICILIKQGLRAVAPYQTKVFVLGKANGFELIGDCVLPNSGLAWPVPRALGDAEILAATKGAAFRLIDYGYRVRIGTLVWNRDKRKRYSTLKKVKNSKATFPLIWSKDISQDGYFEFNRYKNVEHAAFINMVSEDCESVIRRPCVVLQRVTSNDQPLRLVAAPISNKFLKEYGGVVGENHVVFLEQIDKKPAITPAQLAQILRSKPIDRLFRCISGANNVSVFELSQLPLPCPKNLQLALAEGLDMTSAILHAFGKKMSKHGGCTKRIRSY